MAAQSTKEIDYPLKSDLRSDHRSDVFAKPVRFTPCNHLSIGVGVPNCDAIDCALCHDVYQSYASCRIAGRIKSDYLPSGKGSGHTWTICHSDDHPYYGPNTILRWYCCAPYAHGPKCVCPNIFSSTRGCKDAKCCKQYFYCSLADMRRCCVLGPDNLRDVACCWNMHQSINYPIYRILMALELLTGERWDYPIPIVEGLTVAYNPRFQRVFICTRSACDMKDWAQVQALLSPATQITLIDERTMTNLMPGVSYQPRYPRAFIIDQMTSQFMSIIHMCAKYLAIERNDEQWSAMSAKIKINLWCDRILTQATTENAIVTAAPQSDPFTCHYVDSNFIETGISGIPIDVPTPHYNARYYKEQSKKIAEHRLLHQCK